MALGLLLSLHAPAQEPLTVERPIAITLEPLRPAVARGGRGYLVLQITTPEGIWIGAASGKVRAPGPTRLRVKPDPFLTFEPPRWPEPRVEGIPVKLGTTRILTGRIRVVIPFAVAENCPLGARHVAISITYTPGLNAGHLTPHLDEPYEATVEVKAKGQVPAEPPTEEERQPRVDSSRGLHIQRQSMHLDQPFDSMIFHLSEESAVSRFLHFIWDDPDNHDKRVLTAALPWFAGTKNTGFSAGVGVSFLDTTREGVGTAAASFRLVNNEFTGATAELDVLSCPAAYHNYWLSAFHGEDGNRGVYFHTEDLTLDDGRFGYELALNAQDDGRYRFFGTGSRTRESNETAYKDQEFGLELDLFWNFATNWRVSIGGRTRTVNIQGPTRRLADEKPSIFSRFNNVPGLAGSTAVSERLSLIYDHRNQEFTPSDGTFGRLRYTISHLLDDQGDNLSRQWGTFEAMVRRYFSTPGQRYTLILSNRWQLTTGEKRIPFYEQPSLGGPDTLRGFDSGRFFGRNSVFASAELRIQAMHMVLFRMPMDLELSPFIDVGQVFNDFSFGGSFNANPGMSMRILNRPNVGLIINWAFGQDGSLFSGGLTLPF